MLTAIVLSFSGFNRFRILLTSVLHFSSPFLGFPESTSAPAAPNVHRALSKRQFAASRPASKALAPAKKSHVAAHFPTGSSFFFLQASLCPLFCIRLWLSIQSSHELWPFCQSQWCWHLPHGISNAPLQPTIESISTWKFEMVWESRSLAQAICTSTMSLSFLGLLVALQLQPPTASNCNCKRVQFRSNSVNKSCSALQVSGSTSRPIKCQTLGQGSIIWI